MPEEKILVCILCGRVADDGEEKPVIEIPPRGPRFYGKVYSNSY